MFTSRVNYPDRTAFIISKQQLISEIVNQGLRNFHIFLVGADLIQQPHVTVCRGMSFHDTAVRICREML